MRTYFVFQIKKEFQNLYQENNRNLFETLRHLYYMKKHEMNYGLNLFTQLTEKIDKQELNKAIFVRYHNEMVYSKNGNDHVINHLYRDEISVLTIKSSYILITTNHNYSSFFSVISEFGDQYFVCDFVYQDYFWINEIKMLV
ncbi:MAG: sporulation inhibitor of replication protein SirA [bacterium]|nr:sporulation inhibitor of replication protein SirA [bacterium]